MVEDISDNLKIGGAILLLGGLFAGYIAFNVMAFGEPGPKFSCESGEILGFDETVPPQASIAGPRGCEITYTVKSGSEIICEGSKERLGGRNEGTLACEGVSEYEGETVTVAATLYQLDGTEIGSDEISKVYSNSE